MLRQSVPPEERCLKQRDGGTENDNYRQTGGGFGGSAISLAMLDARIALNQNFLISFKHSRSHNS